MDCIAEDYKTVRQEISDRDKGASQFLVLSIVSSATLFSGLSAIFFKMEAQSVSEFGVLIPYTYLAPLLIFIPLYYLIIQHRKDIVRAHTYLTIFHSNSGESWDPRVQWFFKHYPGQSLSAIPWVFWSLLTVSSALFVYWLAKVSNEPYHGIVLLLPFLILVKMHMDFMACEKGMIEEYTAIWLQRKEMERCQQVAPADADKPRR